MVEVGGADFRNHRWKKKEGNKGNGKEENEQTRRGRKRAFTLSFTLSRAHHHSSISVLSLSLLLLAQHVGDLLALGLAARVRPELLLREPQRALLAARLEQLADPALVGGEPGDLADDLADDLDALGGALF